MRPGRSPFPDLVGLYSDEATAVTPTEVTAEAASAGPSFSDFTGLTSSEDEDIAAIRERYFQSLNLQNAYMEFSVLKGTENHVEAETTHLEYGNSKDQVPANHTHTSLN